MTKNLRFFFDLRDCNKNILRGGSILQIGCAQLKPDFMAAIFWQFSYFDIGIIGPYCWTTGMQARSQSPTQNHSPSALWLWTILERKAHCRFAVGCTWKNMRRKKQRLEQQTISPGATKTPLFLSKDWVFTKNNVQEVLVQIQCLMNIGSAPPLKL